MKRLAMANYLDILTLSEPLACVLHAYKRLPSSFIAQVVTIFGAGPIGALHLIQVRQKFPYARLQIVEPVKCRRGLIAQLFPFVNAHADVGGLQPSDLTIVATSHPDAPLAAIRSTTEAGAVLLFSGIDHRSAADLPKYEDHDLETIHRNEEIRTVSNNIRLIGSSGYHPHEINEAIELLTLNPQIYLAIQTDIVEEIDGYRIGDRTLGQPAILELLTNEDVYCGSLKVVFRLDRDDAPDLQVVAADGNGNIAIVPSPLQALSPDLVRVKVRRFSICQTDRRVLRGTKSAQLLPGLVLGHEGIGIIEAVGNHLPRALINTPCIILPHCFEAGDVLEKRGVGYLSRRMRHLGIHLNGVFATRADLPLSCVHPLEAMPAFARASVPSNTPSNIWPLWPNVRVA